MTNKPMTILTLVLTEDIMQKLDALCAQSGTTWEEKAVELLTLALEERDSSSRS